MDQLTFWYKQLVDTTDLNAILANAEKAEHNLVIDSQPTGIYYGLSVAAQNSPNMTVNVTQGVGRDGSGQRVAIPSTQIVDLAVDSLGASTAVVGIGNSRIVSVFAKFARNNSAPFVDGNSVAGYFHNDESFTLKVVQGAEGVAPTAPALDPAMVLLADVTLTHGQTSVVNGNVDLASRRQDAYRTTGTTYVTPRTLARGKPLDAVRDLLSYYNGHVSGSIDRHPATAIDYAGSGTWADGLSGIAGGTVEVSLDAIVAALASTASTTSGADRLGCGQLLTATGGATIAAGSLFAALTALKNSENIDWAADGGLGAATWADLTAVPDGKLGTTVRNLVFTLSSQLGPGSGGSGAAKIGIDGVIGGATTVRGAFVRLTNTTAAADGAAYIGTEAKGSLAGGTVRAQLDELDTGWGKLARTNVWSGAQTFDNVTASGTNKYKLASRSITRAQPMNVLSSPLATGAAITDKFNPPNGVTLTSVAFYFTPGTHGAWPPTTKAGITVWKTNITTGASTNLGSATDPAANLSASNAYRGITLSGLTDVVDRSQYVYWLQFTNESGANAQASNAGGTVITYTATAMDDGY